MGDEQRATIDQTAPRAYRIAKHDDRRMFDEEWRACGRVEAYQRTNAKRAIYPGERNIARYFRLVAGRVGVNQTANKK